MLGLFYCSTLYPVYLWKLLNSVIDLRLCHEKRALKSTVCATVLGSDAEPGSAQNPLFETRLELFNHEKTAHKDENELWVCPFCGNKSITRNNFIRHLKFTPNEKCRYLQQSTLSVEVPKTKDNLGDDENDDVSLLDALQAEKNKVKPLMISLTLLL